MNLINLLLYVINIFPLYVKPRVIYPRTAVPCLKLWTSHYCRFKAQVQVGPCNHATVSSYE